jgi:quercetin dioxygenase-like cupin family protein
MDEKSPIVISASSAPVYEPEGHALTYNQRLAGPFNGSENAEFVIGKMYQGGGAKGHSHSEFDQMMFMLEGELRVVAPGFDCSIFPDDLIVFPKNVQHEVFCVSDVARFIVIYSPPKQELEDR